MTLVLIDNSDIDHLAVVLMETAKKIQAKGKTSFYLPLERARQLVVDAMERGEVPDRIRDAARSIGTSLEKYIECIEKMTAEGKYPEGYLTRDFDERSYYEQATLYKFHDDEALPATGKASKDN